MYNDIISIDYYQKLKDNEMDFDKFKLCEILIFFNNISSMNNIAFLFFQK